MIHLLQIYIGTNSLTQLRSSLTGKVSQGVNHQERIDVLHNRIFLYGHELLIHSSYYLIDVGDNFSKFI
jgi:hypothetical protein